MVLSCLFLLCCVVLALFCWLLLPFVIREIKKNGIFLFESLTTIFFFPSSLHFVKIGCIISAGGVGADAPRVCGSVRLAAAAEACAAAKHRGRGRGRPRAGEQPSRKQPCLPTVPVSWDTHACYLLAEASFIFLTCFFWSMWYATC